MASANPRAISSPYYPPRARWYSPVLAGIDALGRRLGFKFLSVPLPAGMDLHALIAGFLVPGLAIYLRSPGRLGQGALGAAGLLLLTFVIGLGHAVGNLALGMLLSLHTSGFVYYCTPWVRQSLARRLLLTVLTLLVLGLGIYMPARMILQREVLMPLQIHGRVVVVRPFLPTDTIRTGDWLAYDLSASWWGANDQFVEAHAGIGLAPVLAGPGDRLEFSENTFSVNGVARPRLAYMPTTGAFVIPEKQWFIWPHLALEGHGNVAQARITSTLLHMAFVTKGQLIGRPFQRWLGRRQILP